MEFLITYAVNQILVGQNLLHMRHGFVGPIFGKRLRSGTLILIRAGLGALLTVLGAVNDHDFLPDFAREARGQIFNLIHATQDHRVVESLHI